MTVVASQGFRTYAAKSIGRDGFDSTAEDAECNST